MIRKMMIATALMTLAGGLAGAAYSQSGKPMAVTNTQPAALSPALVIEARMDRLEKEVGTLKARVQILCNTVSKQAKTLKAMQGSANSESVTMQPPQSLAGSCL